MPIWSPTMGCPRTANSVPRALSMQCGLIWSASRPKVPNWGPKSQAWEVVRPWPQVVGFKNNLWLPWGTDWSLLHCWWISWGPPPDEVVQDWRWARVLICGWSYQQCFFALHCPEDSQWDCGSGVEDRVCIFHQGALAGSYDTSFMPRRRPWVLLWGKWQFSARVLWIGNSSNWCFPNYLCLK